MKRSDHASTGNTKVLLVSDRDLEKPTGESVHVRNLIKAFGRDPGVDFDFAGPSCSKSHQTPDVQQNETAGTISIDTVFRLLRTTWVTILKSISKRPDLVYVRLSPPLAPIIPLVRILNRRAVILLELNGITEAEAAAQVENSWLFTTVTRVSSWTSTFADGFVAVNQQIADHQREKTSLPVHVAENGTDLDHFVPVSKADIRNNEQIALSQMPTVGFVGHITHWQGVDKLITAFDFLVEDFPQAHLLVVGGGPSLSKMREIAIQKGLRDQTTFVGPVSYDDVPGWIQTFTIGVTPTLVEGTAGTARDSLKNYDYLATGIPVIMDQSQSLAPKVLEAGVGYVFASDDPMELRNLLEEHLKKDDDTRDQMGVKARSLVENERSWSRTTTRIIDIYDQLR